MLNENNTPLAAIAFEQWHPNGTTMAVVAARARLRVDPDGQQYYEPEQALVLADEFDGDPHQSAMTRCNDLIPFKPAADVTLRARLQAAEPAERLLGAVQVDGQYAELRGRGARHWVHDKRWRLTRPEPIAALDIDWTLASGGRIVGDPDGGADPRNPIGTGVIHPDFTPKTVEVPAPQIDSQGAPLSPDPFADVIPQGFGPVAPWWQARQRFAGTYDDDWLANTHPRLPRDFDYRHYQVAAPALVLDHFLAPGSVVQTRGLRPGGDAFGFDIPDIAPFATFRFSDGRDVSVRLHMDGLHLDLRADVPVYDLTWRGWIETCPALYAVDLDMATRDELASMALPEAGPEGLVEAAG